jgi:hypothetical protein
MATTPHTKIRHKKTRITDPLIEWLPSQVPVCAVSMTIALAVQKNALILVRAFVQVLVRLPGHWH